MKTLKLSQTHSGVTGLTLAFLVFLCVLDKTKMPAAFVSNVLLVSVMDQEHTHK